MAFYHNPFIVNGKIRFPDNTNLVKHVERWAKVRGQKLAYRFLDFSTERDGVARDILWSDFSARNRAVGARLQQVTQPGDRIAILCPQNLDYLVSFFGALYSGRIAVPLFDPAEPGHVGRLHAVLDDCAPSTILTTTDSAEGVRKFIRARSAKERPRVIAVDAVPTEVAATWQEPEADEGTTAYLQYTSGSTRTPTGVQISHLNLPTNVLQTLVALEGTEGDRGVSWLPFFHDMGLITALCAPVLGQSFTFMTPAAFVRRPGRWIRELARKPDDPPGCGTFSAAPNFAFEHAAVRGLPRDDEPPLDLSNVKGILNGSEPVSPASMRKFFDAFRPYGLKETSVKPSYGLAEATLFVSTTPMNETPTDHPRRPERAEQPALRRGGRRRAERRRTGLSRQDRCRRMGGHRRHRDAPASCRTGRSARSGCTARTWASATGARKKRPPRLSGTSSSRGSASRTPREPRTTGCGYAPATTAPTSRDTSISRAGSRTLSSSTAATTTRRTWSTRRRNRPRRCASATWPPSRRRPTSCPRTCSTTRTPG